jgi:hypothetical protein
VILVDLAVHLAELEVKLQLRLEQGEFSELVEKDNRLYVERFHHDLRGRARLRQRLAPSLGQLGLPICALSEYIAPFIRGCARLGT